MLLTSLALIIVSCDLGNVFGAVARINENNDATLESSVFVSNDVDIDSLRIPIRKETDRALWNALSPASIETYHGYVSNPPSRANLCQLRVNKDCGLIVYEPQSIEGGKGFPYGSRSPPDGKIASGGKSAFEKLDEYGENRWSTVAFPEMGCFNETHFYFNFTWTMTAPHSTDSIRIFASNENYTRTKPLSRRQLNLNPICSIKLYGKQPPRKFTFQCPISKEEHLRLYRSNDLLLLSVWDIQDTVNAFYQVIDLERLPENESYENIRNKCNTDRTAEQIV